MSSRSDPEQSVESERSTPSARPQSVSSETVVTHIPELTALNANSIAPYGDETFPALFPDKLLAESAVDLLELDENRVETKFGGLFYLINLGIFMELYSDFTAPLGSNLALSIFDFVALIGRRLLNEQITDDPVWELLGQLAGRSELDGPGKEFEAPSEWRLPASWLEAFPGERRYDWTTYGQRLQVRHPAGFLLLDVPISKRPFEQVKREMKAYDASVKRQKSRRPFTTSRSDSRLERWLNWITPYVRMRLCRALGIPDASDPALVVCAQRASIVLTDVHLDIFFALSQHPLEIRLAGLDRNPGWVPAAGRFVRFHYR